VAQQLPETTETEVTFVEGGTLAQQRALEVGRLDRPGRGRLDARQGAGDIAFELAQTLLLG